MQAEFDKNSVNRELILPPSPYLIRYVKIKQARDVTLQKIDEATEGLLARDTFMYILDQQRMGVNIADSAFIKQHKNIITASLPMLKIALQQMYVTGLFDELLDVAQPEKRTPASIPLNEKVNFVETGEEFEESNTEIFEMYAHLLGITRQQITTNFKAEESVIIFFSAVADHVPLHPFPSKQIAQQLAPSIQVPSVGEIIHVPTKLPGVSVEYAYLGSRETPETSLLVKPLS
jgi:hypothetical protein